jgi:hypothetical protein
VCEGEIEKGGRERVKCHKKDRSPYYDGFTLFDTPFFILQYNTIKGS